jgi:hypothetical protein
MLKLIKINKNLLTIFLLLFMIFTVGKADRECPVGWVINQNYSYCYRVGVANQAKTWEAARDACKSYGGDLLSITDYNDRVYLFSANLIFNFFLN